jgi:enoyl-CoA hydratase/carnithine racemase
MTLNQAAKLEEATLTLAKKISQKSPLTIKWAKSAINNSQETSLVMGLNIFLGGLW